MARRRSDHPYEYGPTYPNLPGLEKYRRLCRYHGSVAALDWQTRREYGYAVLKAILGLQRSELMKILTPTPSTNYYKDGDELCAAIRARQAAALHRKDGHTWGCKPEQQEKRYKEAMAAKRAALAEQQQRDEDWKADQWAMSNGLSVVTPCGTLINGEAP